MANEKLWIATVDGRALPKPVDVRRDWTAPHGVRRGPGLKKGCG